MLDFLGVTNFGKISLVVTFLYPQNQDFHKIRTHKGVCCKRFLVLIEDMMDVFLLVVKLF